MSTLSKQALTATVRVRRAWLIALALLAAGAAAFAGAAKSPVRFEKLAIAGDDHRNGIFDVSVEYGADETGWMVYSRVDLPKHVETHLARSDDQGRSWTYVAALNKSADDTVRYRGKKTAGVWRYETPTLVFDPADRPDRRWKFFVLKYFAKAPFKKGNSLFPDGMVEYRHAAGPEGPWSEPVCLFGRRDQDCRVDLHRLDPSLRKQVFYGELGSIEHRGVIYLSLDSGTTDSGLGDWKNRSMILVASTDHGATWRYVGKLTDYDDASRLGYVTLTGSSLVTWQGRQYLIASPSGRKGLFVKNRAHDGTIVVKFEDLARGRLQRSAQGNLVVLRHLKPDRNTGGLSDFHERNRAGGMLFCQIDLKAPPDVFQVFNTGAPLLVP